MHAYKNMRGWVAKYEWYYPIRVSIYIWCHKYIHLVVHNKRYYKLLFCHYRSKVEMQPDCISDSAWSLLLNYIFCFQISPFYKWPSLL